MKTTSIKTAFGMYINYFFLGITRRKRLGQQLAESNSGNDITDAGRIGSCANCAGYHRFFLRLFNHGCFSNLHYINDRLFWKRKGAVTGIVATASSIASIVLQIATGLIAKAGGIAHIFMFDFCIAVLGTAAAAFLYYRYRKLTGAQADVKL